MLQMLGSHAGFEVLLIKNRLMFAFDASVSGGYRDLLLNLRCLADGAHRRAADHARRG